MDEEGSYSWREFLGSDDAPPEGARLVCRTTDAAMGPRPPLARKAEGGKDWPKLEIGRSDWIPLLVGDRWLMRVRVSWFWFLFYSF